MSPYTSSFILEEEEKIMNDVTHTKSKRKISGCFKREDVGGSPESVPYSGKEALKRKTTEKK